MWVEPGQYAWFLQPSAHLELLYAYGTYILLLTNLLRPSRHQVILPQMLPRRVLAHRSHQKTGGSVRASIVALPSELLAEIARHLPSRHSVTGYVTDSANLLSFSMTSRQMRIACIPVLFRDVPIVSERKLKALQSLPSQLVGYIK